MISLADIGTCYFALDNRPIAEVDTLIEKDLQGFLGCDAPLSLKPFRLGFFSRPYGKDGTLIGRKPRGFGQQFKDGNVCIGTTTASYPLEMGSGARVTTGGIWTDASSIEYKTDIALLTLDKALEALSDLRPVTFSFKAATDERHVGFIAEEVPDLVATKDRKGLSPMDIVAVLTKVVQQQQKEIDELKARLDAGQ